MKSYVLLAFLFVTSIVQAQISFQKYYGDTSHFEYALGAQPVSTGGYIVAASSDTGGSGQQDICLMRTDAYGNMQWKKFFGSSVMDIGTCATETNDGGFILCGSWHAFGGDTMVVIKTDVNGNVQWMNWYKPDSDRWLGEYIIQTADGGYAIGGFTDHGGFFVNMVLFRLTSTGTELWHKLYGGSSGNNDGLCVREVNGNGFVLSGTTTSSGHGGKDMWLVRTDANGDTLWTRTSGTSQDEQGEKVWMNSDGGFAVAGFENFPGGDAILWRTDASGNTVWTRQYDDGGWENAYGVQQTWDGGFAIAGRSDNAATPIQAWLIRTDANGTMLWDRKFPSGRLSDFYDLVETSDGGFILSGGRTDSTTYRSSIYLVKTGPAGYVNVNELYVPSHDDFSVFPNPASEFSEMHFSAALPGRRIRLSDMNGKILLDEICDADFYRMNVADLANGIYILSAISESGISSKRIIVAH